VNALKVANVVSPILRFYSDISQLKLPSNTFLHGTVTRLRFILCIISLQSLKDSRCLYSEHLLNTTPDSSSCHDRHQSYILEREHEHDRKPVFGAVSADSTVHLSAKGLSAPCHVTSSLLPIAYLVMPATFSQAAGMISAFSHYMLRFSAPEVIGHTEHLTAIYPIGWRASDLSSAYLA
jgi:hypothetical protein